METIFDHSPTDDELKAHFGRIVPQKDYVAMDQQTEYALIYSLYAMRGDRTMMDKYRALISPEYFATCVGLNDLP